MAFLPEARIGRSIGCQSKCYPCSLTMSLLAAIPFLPAAAVAGVWALVQRGVVRGWQQGDGLCLPVQPVRRGVPRDDRLLNVLLTWGDYSAGFESCRCYSVATSIHWEAGTRVRWFSLPVNHGPMSNKWEASNISENDFDLILCLICSLFIPPYGTWEPARRKR